MNRIATFSIVAFDPNKKEWGVAVQSKFLAAAAVVSWARAKAGAVATQSFANLRYGNQGLDFMAEGMSARETLTTLTEADDQRNMRQLGLVDQKGGAAAYTGKECFDWAGHIVGESFACQGNILIPGTVEAMAKQFEKSRNGSGELADWLVETLAAGQEAGGDSRGRQAAGVLVVRDGGGYGGNNDRYLDLRVDDDPRPIQKLGQLVNMHHLYFGEVDKSKVLPLNEVAKELQQLLTRTGHYKGAISNHFNDESRKALRVLVGNENLEERWDGSGDTIDLMVVEYLRDRFKE